MCAVDWDEPRFYSTVERKARKLHSCDECRRTINPGENYQYAVGLWETKLSQFKTCRFCKVAQDWLLKECGIFLHGGLDEEIEEHANEYKKIFLYKWLIGIRSRWIHMNSVWREQCSNG
jgi:hypothetical protein